MTSLYDYCKALDYCKFFFINSLEEFKISLVALFGSATFPGCFSFETSDLDIIALTDLTVDDYKKVVSGGETFNSNIISDDMVYRKKETK